MIFRLKRALRTHKLSSCQRSNVPIAIKRWELIPWNGVGGGHGHYFSARIFLKETKDDDKGTDF